MAQLAIKGHATRGIEVIKLLEMFGAKHGNCCGGNYLHRIYYINEYNLIETCDRMLHLDYLQLTLEEFLEKFPFKVGDKVLINEDENDVYTVKSMVWHDAFNRVAYRIEAVDGIMHDNAWFAHEMVLFNRKKEEDVEEKGDKAKAPNLIGEDYSGKRYGYKIPNGYEFDCIKNDEIILKPKQPQYPKTYKECCKILGISTMANDAQGYEWEKMVHFQELLVARDAYWKIAGEQMGLGQPWKPDYLNHTKEIRYFFFNTGISIENGQDLFPSNKILIFPSEEMRDAFYENFKDLIESCKELL